MTWNEKPDELRNGACVGHHRLFFAPYAERPTNRIVRVDVDGRGAQRFRGWNVSDAWLAAHVRACVRERV